MAELPLYDVERDAFAGHLDGVGVAELVRREAASHPGPRRWCAGARRGPRRVTSGGRALCR